MDLSLSSSGRPLWLAVFAVVSISTAASVSAEPAVTISFNGPDAKWRLLETVPQARLLAQEIVHDGARDASGSERLRVSIAPGQSAVLVLSVGRMPVLDELRASIWIKASRPGVQLAARVTLPRSAHPTSGSAATTIVRGDQLQRPDHWQSLNLSNVPRLLANEVRVLRASQQAGLDAREAYVDAMVLLVPGGPQDVEVLTDELTIHGILLQTPQNGPAAAAPSQASAPIPAALTDRRTTEATDNTGAAQRSRVDEDGERALSGMARRVRLQGGALLVDGKAFVPRVIQWNGEPFGFLAELGFNAVELTQPLTDEQFQEIEKHDLWLVIPPPSAAAPGDAGQQWDRVLVWRLEDDEALGNPSHFRNLAQQLRARRDLPPRPIIVVAGGDWAPLSHAADIVAAAHPNGASCPVAEFESWLADQTRRSRMGTPVWAAISTQFGEAATTQASALSGQSLQPLSVDNERLEASVQAAYLQGCRGVLFRSYSSLSGSDPATRRRAALLALINEQLRFIGPWIGRGVVAGQIHSTDGAAKAAVLWVDSARLLVPLDGSSTSAENGPQSTPSSHIIRHSQSSPAVRGSSPRLFVMPGIPDSSQAFIATPASLRRIPTRRVAGGNQLALDSGEIGMIVVTQDPQAIAALRQHVASQGPQTVRRERDLARMWVDAIADETKQIPKLGRGAAELDVSLGATTRQLPQVDALLASGRAEHAYTIASGVRRGLQVEADRLRHLIARETGFEAGSPLALDFDMLNENMSFGARIQTLQGRENLLYGGDFEDLGQMTAVGWQHLQASTSNQAGSAELSSAEPKNGKYCLRLLGPSASTEAPPTDGPRLPIFIISPPMRVDRGTWIEITGWVRVGRADSRAGRLEVMDTFGGRELALNIVQTAGWEPFRLIRAATGDEVRLTIRYWGHGSAELDALMVRPLAAPVARRLPSTPQEWPIVR
jgi:hypothetical protein